MRYLLCILLFISSLAQAEPILLDNDMSLVQSEAEAVYYLKDDPVKQDDTWLANIYYYNTDNLYLECSLTGPSFINDKTIGPYKYYHPNGQISVIGNFNEQGEHEGLITFYDDSGLLTSKQTLVNGKRNGKMTYFYPNGNISRTFYLDNEKMSGEDISYFVDGTIKSVTNWINGKKEGSAKAYDHTGQIRLETNYLADQHTGKQITYNKDGTIRKHEYYRNNALHGKQEIFSEKTGKLIKESYFNNGLKDGAEITYDEASGMVWVINHWKKGNPAGTSTTYYQGTDSVRSTVEVSESPYTFHTLKYDINGELTSEVTSVYKDKNMAEVSRSSKQYKNGVLTSHEQKDFVKDWRLTESFNDDGELTKRRESLNDYRVGLYLTSGHDLDEGNYHIKAHYTDGDLNGSYKKYKDDGTILKQGNYLNDRKVGKWVSTYNDQIETQHFNDQGQKHGLHKITTKAGQVIFSLNYTNGEKDGVLKVYHNGKIISTGLFVKGKRDGNWIEPTDYADFIDYDTDFEYAANKETSKGKYNLDKKIGKWISYSAKGYVTSTIEYDNAGLAQGISYQFEQNGAIYKILFYKDNILLKEIQFYEGKRMSITTFDKNGYMLDEKYVGENAALYE